MSGAATTPPATPPRPPPGRVATATANDSDVFLSARVPRSLRDELRHQAIREGRPTAELLQDAVRAYLTGHTT